jgi:hypothetical protein
MKKSEYKKKAKAKKNADKQKRHQVKLYNIQARREARQQYHLDKAFKKAQHTQDRDAHDERIKEQLQRNMEILAALEKQYNDEQASKKQINSDLEDQGLSTLEDKMKHLSDMYAAQQKKEVEDKGFGMSG